MTLEEKRTHLKTIKPMWVIIGYLKNDGKFDAAIILSDEDLEKEKPKFEILKQYKIKTNGT